MLEQIARNLATNVYKPRTHVSIPLDTPTLPNLKAYSVIPEGSTYPAEVVDRCVELLPRIITKLTPEEFPNSFLGFASLNGDNFSSLYVTVFQWNVLDRYPSTNTHTIYRPVHRGGSEILTERSVQPCLFDIALAGWESTRWFEFLRTNRSLDDLNRYMEDRYTGPLPIPTQQRK